MKLTGSWELIKIRRQAAPVTVYPVGCDLDSEDTLRLPSRLTRHLKMPHSLSIPRRKEFLPGHSPLLKRTSTNLSFLAFDPPASRPTSGHSLDAILPDLSQVMSQCSAAHVHFYKRNTASAARFQPISPVPLASA